MSDETILDEWGGVEVPAAPAAEPADIRQGKGSASFFIIDKGKEIHRSYNAK